MPEAIDVLIVEDDPMVAAIHRQFIGAVPGFIVAGVVSSGKDALEFLQRHPVRLVILDVFLPGMDGVATLQRIREMNRTVGVIVVSASRDTNTINAVLKAGAFDYVIKPFVFERIQTSLRSFQQLENRLNRGADQIDQKELDKLLQVQQKDTAANDLPKGLNPQTLQQVKNLLGHAASPLSSVETAQALKISRITARRYLEYLVAAGEATLELEYQKVGRPTNRYALRK
ncbi:MULTISPECIES: response regulator [unclassified Pyramidobacter]|uniref:response regulator n=1 Tax=unclassified Pyramidobacter TaxID=2632171 RepID=UPI00098EADD9|nr:MULTISPECIES: response regulator [unclassified Pyramidobacter]OON87853.1 response regulator [Pyramidobacter sp. C12-8]RKJ77047.1 response regulator [Pyramidobacter sp. CG50-2]WOL39511.1 response regulator [Pyramidobacter sp. YE332]